MATPPTSLQTSLQSPFTGDEANALGSQIASLKAATVTAQTAASAAVPQAFTPSVSTNWSPAPTTVQAALDQIAARLHAGSL